MPKIELLPSGSFRMRPTVNGKTYTITAKTERELIDKYFDFRSNADIEEYKRRYPESMTVRESMQQFIDGRSAVLSPSTIRGYHIIMNNAFPSIMDRPIERLQNRDVQDAINLACRQKSGKTISNEWRCVSCAIQRATGKTYNVQLPQIMRNEHEFLTAEQIPVFLEAIRGTKVEIAALLGLHSLRRSEILDVTWNDIDLDHDLIMVRGSAVYDENYLLVHKKENKNSTSRRSVPIIIPRLKELLLEADPKTGYVVKLAPNTVQRSIDRACAKAGLPIIGTHGLRHSYASLCLHAGLSPDIAARIGGWKDLNTMKKIYTHISNKDLNTAAEKLAAFFTDSHDKIP